jgi:hypothetical protein
VPDREDGVDVGAWLRGLGLERYEQAFRDNDVHTAVLPELIAVHLSGLGITSVGETADVVLVGTGVQLRPRLVKTDA